MIEYIKGLIAYKTPTYIIVETAGLGYRVNISLHTYAKVKDMEQVQILVFTKIAEDAHTLYGFADDNERSLFLLLISVSGVGTNTAQVLLSSLSPDEIRVAIIGEDERTFSKVKGIGPKTAKRIILDLKDKVVKESGDAPQLMLVGAVDNTLRDDAISALLALGFQRINIQKALNKIMKEQPEIKTVDTLIKAGLKALASG